MRELDRLKMVEIEISKLIVNVNERNEPNLKPAEINQLTRFLVQLRAHVQEQIKELQNK